MLRNKEENTMRNYKEETEKRVAFIRQVLAESGCKGIVRKFYLKED